MFVFGRLLEGLAGLLDGVLTLYLWILIISAVLSWVNPDPRNRIVQFLNAATWPVLFEIRRRVPVVYGGLDLSPLVAILGISLIRYVLVASLYDVAARLVAT
jgi:YggT family protein